MRTLLIHIGCAKGGSSAIQKALRLNWRKLASRGVAVPTANLHPDSEVTGQHARFFEACVRERRATPIPALGDLLDSAADEHSASTIVLSAENLSNPMGFERLFAELMDRFDIRIVMYVRRQDDFLEASWQQWDIKLGGSLLAWMIKNIGARGNWETTWSHGPTSSETTGLPSASTTARGSWGGDVFLDFCEVLGQDPEDLEPPGEANPSLSPMLSHNLNMVRHICDYAVWLDAGSIRKYGPVEQVVAEYQGVGPTGK